MLIDAARDWNEKPTPEEVALYGHGIVPIKIDDIVHTKEDEMKFLVYDVSEKWNTYNYYFPVPMKDDKYPYIGMEIKTNNRLDPKDGMGIRFGVVVTLKENNGINRIDEFIKNCTLNGWLVNRIDVQARVDINRKVNEDIEFE